MDKPGVLSETMASLVRFIDVLAKLNDDASSLSLPTLELLRGLLGRAEKEVEASKNAHLPAVRLPPEILQYIFRLASQKVKDPPHLPSNATMAAGDIWSFVEPIPAKAATIASVCRRWRSVALADSTLWNLISDRRDRRPLTVSRQYESTALELRLRASPSHAVRTLLESAGHRVKAIEWDRANAGVGDLDVLAASACRLDKLVLSMSRHLPAVDAQTLTRCFAAQAPSLRQLTLRDCAALPDSHFPRLTGLHLDVCPGPNACDSLLGLLARAPNLTDLVLSRLQMPDASPDMPAPVALPYLRRLVFVDMARGGITSFLLHVDLPDETSIRIHASQHAVPNASVDAQLFAALARTPALRDASDLYVSGEGDIFVAGRAAAVCFVQQSERGTVGQRRASPQAPAWDAHIVLRHVLASARIRKLWLVGDSEGIVDPRRNSGIPALAPSVDTVVVQDVALPAALHALERRAVLSPLSGGESSVDPDESAASSRSITVHVLMTRFMSVGVVLSKLAQHPDAKNGHVVIGYQPAYKGDRAPPSGFEGSFASLRFVAHEEEPRVALPEVCAAPAHCLWPAWAE
ncbi:hypothetical protein DAEQUDRAFT_727415 [Daedalea quercina L-15889]|uniref:Uncharacterized protein n=1 Tax=Daedalea quercina L-15889 TaxID=1314783 RepID=A0A165PY51_9APHY|nr:hypothetical protein DAEQUDRAFT_727415 [Daedalea quercina L-15889]